MIIDNNEKIASLEAKVKAIDVKLKLAMEESPPGDTSIADMKVEYWEQGKQDSLSKEERGIEYLEEQIRQIKETAEKKMMTIQTRLDQARRKYREKEAFFTQRLMTAQHRVGVIQEKACPKVRKYQLEKEALIKEIDACNCFAVYIAKKSGARTARNEVINSGMSDASSVASNLDGYDSEELAERFETAEKALKMGMRKNTATDKWEHPKEEEEYYGEMIEGKHVAGGIYRNGEFHKY